MAAAADSFAWQGLDLDSMRAIGKLSDTTAEANCGYRLTIKATFTNECLEPVV